MSRASSGFSGDAIATERISFSLPNTNASATLPVVGSQIFAVLSEEPVTTNPAPIANLTDFTAPLCPVNFWRTEASATDHRIATPSSDPVSTFVPSGENATDLISPARTPKAFRNAPSDVDHRSASPVLAPVSIDLPSGENATAKICALRGLVDARC